MSSELDDPNADDLDDDIVLGDARDVVVPPFRPATEETMTDRQVDEADRLEVNLSDDAASGEGLPPPPDYQTLPPLAQASGSPTVSRAGSAGWIWAVLGAAVLVFLFAGGLRWVTGLLGDTEDNLKTGDCIKSLPFFSGQHVDKVSCTRGTYRVVSNTAATGSGYPGNLATLENSCESQGGTAVSPSRSTWEDDGDRNVLCVKLF